MFKWNRWFHRKPSKEFDVKRFEISRAVTGNGTSHTVSIPPVVIKDMGLENGVTIKRRGDRLIITKIRGADL